MLRRTTIGLLVALLASVGAPGVQAQTKTFKAQLLKSWEQVGPQGSQIVRVEYACSNTLVSRRGTSVEGKGIMLSRDRTIFPLLKETSGKYELFVKGYRQVFRKGKKGDFAVAEQKHGDDHPLLKTYMHPRELLMELTRNADQIRRAGTQGVKGKVCKLYRLTFEEHSIGGLLRRLGLEEETVAVDKKKKSPAYATCAVESRTGRLREIQVSFSAFVKSEKQKKKDKDWSWEGGGGGGMGVILEQDGKILNPPSDRDKGAELRRYIYKVTFGSAEEPKDPSELEVPDSVKELLRW